MAFFMSPPEVPFLSRDTPLWLSEARPPPFKRMRLGEGIGGGFAAYSRLLGELRAVAGGGYGAAAAAAVEARGIGGSGGAGRAASLISGLAGRAVGGSLADPAAFGPMTDRPLLLPARVGEAGMMVECSAPPREDELHSRPEMPVLPEPHLQRPHRPQALRPGATLNGGALPSECTAIVPFLDLPHAIRRCGGPSAPVGDQDFAESGEAGANREGEEIVEELIMETKDDEVCAVVDSMDCT